MKLQVGDVITSWRFRGWYKIVSVDHSTNKLTVKMFMHEDFRPVKSNTKERACYSNMITLWSKQALEDAKRKQVKFLEQQILDTDFGYDALKAEATH